MTTGSHAVTIVLEVHCHIPGNKASLWLVPRVVDLESDDCPELADVTDIQKLIGPLSATECGFLYESLANALRKSGMHVATFTTADD